MKSKICLLLILLSVFCACSEQKSLEPVYKITFDEKNFVDVRNVVNDLEFILLDTIPEANISNITDMYICNDRIYCFSNSNSGYVCVFSLDGDFLFKISHVGKAKNEWLKLSSMYVNDRENRIVLTDNYGLKILEYTLDGEYVRTVPIQLINNRENGYHSGYYYSVTNPYMTGDRIARETDHLINICDSTSKFNNVSELIDVKQNSAMIMQERVNRLYNGVNGLLAAPTLDPTVYKLDGLDVLPYADFEYTGNKIQFYNDEDIEEGVIKNLFMGGLKKSFYSGSIVESPQYLIRRLGYADAVDVIYDKKSGKTVLTRFDSDKLGERHLSELFAYKTPYCYYKGFYYGKLTTDLLSFPGQYTEGHVPKELSELKELSDKNQINNVIVRYKINL